MNISKFIDHTNIRKNATEEDIKTSCEEAKKYNFRGLCVRPEWTKTAKDELLETETKIITLIDPPMGLSSFEERIKMAKEAKENGSDEIDVVMNIVDLKYKRYDKILEDLKEIGKIAPMKVIIGSGYLTGEEIKKASELVKESGAICVKTATEKDPLDYWELEEKAKHLKIMKENAQGLLVKVAGQVRTLKDAVWMIESGADIIGTSKGVEIAEEAKQY